MGVDDRLLRSHEVDHTLQRNRSKLAEYCINNAVGGARFKGHFHTLIGFVLGFMLALATLLFYDRYLLLSEQLERHTTATEYYQSGYKTALKEVSTVEETLQQRLVQEVRVLCMVLTCPEYHESRAAHVRATWGRRCTKLIFISSSADAELGIVNVVEDAADIYYNLWNKTREAFRYVYEQHVEEYDWFLKADDDTYVIMENLRYMLYGYYSETPLYFGHKMVRYGVEYMSGGATYVLSKEALRRFMTKSFHNKTLCPNPHRRGAEDFYMGICLQNVGVYLADSRFATPSDDKPKMFPLSLLAYMEPKWNTTIPDWLIDMTPYPTEKGLQCCSNYSIAFHYASPERIYTYEYLIYHLQTFGQRRQVGKLPIKRSTTEVKSVFPRKPNWTIVDMGSVDLPDNF